MWFSWDSKVNFHGGSVIVDEYLSSGCGSRVALSLRTALAAMNDSLVSCILNWRYVASRYVTLPTIVVAAFGVFYM
jgi:hypothetical protein